MPKHLKITPIIVLVLFCIQCVHGQSADHFVLNGRINGVDNRMIYVSYYDEYMQTGKLDSSFIKNGKFSFSGKLKQPTVAFIKLNKKEAIGINATDIFLEPAKLDLDITFNDFGKAHLQGSKTQDDYEEIKRKGSRLMNNHPLLFDSNGYVRNDLSSELTEQLAIVLDSLNRIDYEYFNNHPTSYLTAYLLQYQVRNLSADSLAIFYNRLGDDLKQHPVTQTIRSRLKNMTAGSIGSVAPKFFAKDTSGNEFYSGFLIGKYILLDFWASWCIPCRQNSPYLVELYKKYYNRGFRIIGVADDRDLSKWKDAITKDKTGIWTHVRREADQDLKMKGLNDGNDINEKFKIATLPTYILIDSYGVIIGRFEDNNGSFNELSQKLELLFSEAIQNKKMIR